MKIKDLDLLNDPRRLFEKKQYYLYGASGGGKRMSHLLEKLNIPVASFIDSDEKKQGTVWEDRSVIPPQALNDIDPANAGIIIASSYAKEIIGAMEQMDLPDSLEVCTGWSVRRAIYSALCADADYLDETLKEQAAAVSSLWGKRRHLYMLHRLQLPDEDFIRMVYDPDTILICNPTKVGSRTIYRSLQQLHIPCIHTHSIANSMDWMDMAGGEEKEKRREWRKYLIRSRRSVHGAPLRIITGVREPVSHGISLYWQLMDELCLKESRDFQTMQEACLEFIKKFTWLPPAKGEIPDPLYGFYSACRKGRKYGMEFDWYDQCLKRELGVDVYAFPFDREKGYAIIRTDYVEIFLYRMEDLNNLEKELADFVGNSDFHLLDANRSTDKEYQFAYKEFMKTFNPPQELIDFYYKGNPYMDHFYTEEQKKEMLKRWF